MNSLALLLSVMFSGSDRYICSVVYGRKSIVKKKKVDDLITFINSDRETETEYTYEREREREFGCGPAMLGHKIPHISARLPEVR